MIVILPLNADDPGLYVTSPQESSHPEDNWGFVVTYLKSISRSNTTASIKNVTTTTAASAHVSESAQCILAFRAISDEIDDLTTLSSAKPATFRSRHLDHTVKRRRSRSRVAKITSSEDTDDDTEDGCMSSQQKVKIIVELLCNCCMDAGAFDPDAEQGEHPSSPFVMHKTIQRYVDAAQRRGRDCNLFADRLSARFAFLATVSMKLKQ